MIDKKPRIVDGKLQMSFGRYTVVENKKKSFYGIYVNGKLISSRQSWRSATRTALLLHKAYQEGYEDRRSDEYYNRFYY